MTKKHFIALADALRRSAPLFASAGREAQWRNDVHVVSWFLLETYPRFDRSKWIAYINGECTANGKPIKPTASQDQSQTTSPSE